MSLTGKNALSIRKKEVKEQRSIAIGFTKTVFAHKAAAGDTGFNLSSLTSPGAFMPTFVNPNVSELTQVNLNLYQKNLTLVSSAKGVLVKDLSYKISGSNQITFLGFTALEDEIFSGVIDQNPKTELKAVDATHINRTGTLAIGATDFNVGTPFETNKFSSEQIGAVQVFRNGLIQFRNTGNSASTLDGNYYEVSAGAGLGTLIRFNVAPVGSADNILVVANGLLVERPDGSMMAEIEKVQGQMDSVVETLAVVAGVPETNFQVAPNNTDLAQFGDLVLSLKLAFNSLLVKLDNDTGINDTDYNSTLNVP